jgi:3-isopropylmalate/(R)-2-methylmalate dehydratase small subunit
MTPFRIHTGTVVPIDRPNIDTDQIIPKQFLKRIERTGFDTCLFNDWRYLADGTPNPDFALNFPRYKGASILVAGKNFGCGSSREHAPWSLSEYGFRVIIAPSFADIFRNNSLKNGLLTVTLSDEDTTRVIQSAETREGYALTVDLERETVNDGEGFEASFSIEPFRKTCLLNGLDDIGLTLRHADDISLFEAGRPAWLSAAAS